MSHGRAVWWPRHANSCRHHTVRSTWADLDVSERQVADHLGPRTVRVYKVQCTACEQQYTGYVGRDGTLVNVGR